MYIYRKDSNLQDLKQPQPTPFAHPGLAPPSGSGFRVTSFQDQFFFPNTWLSVMSRYFWIVNTSLVSPSALSRFPLSEGTLVLLYLGQNDKKVTGVHHEMYLLIITCPSTTSTPWPPPPSPPRCTPTPASWPPPPPSRSSDR